MSRKMKLAWGLLTVCLLAMVIVAIIQLANQATGDAVGGDAPDDDTASAMTGPALTLALIPERNIYAQRRRYQLLADALGQRIGRPIELVTLTTYLGVLDEFEDGDIDAAFLGSMVSTLAHDRTGARVLVKPVTPEGISTYRGVIFVQRDSSIEKVADLAGRSIAMVRTTTAGNLFPIYQFEQIGLLHGENPPELRWVGTHDDVIREVAQGRVAAGAAKDLRLYAFEAEQLDQAMRKLVISRPVPNNALLVRPDLDPLLVEELVKTLLTMHEDAQGAAVLEQFGAARFVPCSIDEYQAVYDMVDALGEDWHLVGVDGPPPMRPPHMTDARTEPPGD
jgi:phosphonate transport system substrate-binding protein